MKKISYLLALLLVFCTTNKTKIYQGKIQENSKKIILLGDLKVKTSEISYGLKDHIRDYLTILLLKKAFLVARMNESNESYLKFSRINEGNDLLPGVKRTTAGENNSTSDQFSMTSGDYIASLSRQSKFDFYLEGSYFYSLHELGRKVQIQDSFIIRIYNSEGTILGSFGVSDIHEDSLNIEKVIKNMDIIVEEASTVLIK